MQGTIMNDKPVEKRLSAEDIERLKNEIKTLKNQFIKSYKANSYKHYYAQPIDLLQGDQGIINLIEADLKLTVTAEVDKLSQLLPLYKDWLFNNCDKISKALAIKGKNGDQNLDNQRAEFYTAIKASHNSIDGIKSACSSKKTPLASSVNHQVDRFFPYGKFTTPNWLFADSVNELFSLKEDVLKELPQAITSTRLSHFEAIKAYKDNIETLLKNNTPTKKMHFIHALTGFLFGIFGHKGIFHKEIEVYDSVKKECNSLNTHILNIKKNLYYRSINPLSPQKSFDSQSDGKLREIDKKIHDTEVKIKESKNIIVNVQQEPSKIIDTNPVGTAISPKL
jgi:hypothetical protein